MAKASQERDQLEFVTEIGTLTTKYKVNIPGECLSILTWPLEPGRVQLIACLMDVGRVRLYLETDVRAQIESLREEIQQSGEEYRVESG